MILTINVPGNSLNLLVNHIMVQFEFAVKKNIIVWVNTVNPEMWRVSVLVGKGRFNENVLGFTDGGAGKFHLHSR